MNLTEREQKAKEDVVEVLANLIIIKAKEIEIGNTNGVELFGDTSLIYVLKAFTALVTDGKEE